MTKERAYPPDWVTADTLAYLIECSRKSIDEWVKSGILPRPVRISGTSLRWRRADVDDWLQERAASASLQEKKTLFDLGALREGKKTHYRGESA
jgi:predicted DNA-binding transcriptional regulator AlpA